MNVEEMIRELKKYPKDMPVTVLCSYVSGIRKKTVYVDDKGNFDLIKLRLNTKEVEVLAII